VLDLRELEADLIVLDKAQHDVLELQEELADANSVAVHLRPQVDWKDDSQRSPFLLTFFRHSSNHFSNHSSIVPPFLLFAQLFFLRARRPGYITVSGHH